MSVIQLLLAAEAAAQNRAVRRTAFRHRRLAERPLVITAYNLSGEAAAPIAFCYGTDPKKPKLVIAAEPRNRDSRFGAINAFCADVAAYITPFLELVEQPARRGAKPRRVALDAPQIVVPNRATREYIGARLGRSLRYLGLGETHDVPAETKWTGAHLSWLADHAHFPGQSVFLAATELLTRHFVTGQSDLENENLGSLLAWIDNEPGAGRKLIEAAEGTAYGPVPDPAWEVLLEPLVRQWTEQHRAENAAGKARVEKHVRALVEPELQLAYDATWAALARAREIPEAASVSSRWAKDVVHWSSYAWRAERAIPRFAKRHDAVRAAHMLEEWSSALQHLEFEETFDDPLVMADVDAAGRCVTGKVTSIDADNTEVKPGNVRRTQVPLISITLAGASNLLPGDQVVWSGDTRVTGQVRKIDATKVVVAISAGHVGATRLPSLGSVTLFAALKVFDGRSPLDPRAVPWTHQLTADAASEGRGEGPPTAGGDDSPDMTAAELAALPLVGLAAPEDVPEVLM